MIRNFFDNGQQETNKLEGFVEIITTMYMNRHVIVTEN